VRASIVSLRTSCISEAVLTIRTLDLTQALNPLLQDFAGQIETMSSSGKLSGAERGSLAEALLAVAGPSGPVRVREVLEWLIAPVRQRWVPNGALSPEVSHLLSPQGMAAGEAAGGTQGLSSAHWELFHDIQLTERCMRRSLGDAESARLPTGLMKPVDPPPPISECPAADHIQWAIRLVSSLLQTIHTYWTPEGRATMHAIGLGKSLEMSPEEKAAYLVHGPARTHVLDDEDPGVTQTAAASRDWMRCLRDCSYSVFTLFSVHAAAAFYPSPEIAAICGASILAHLPCMELRHVRQCVHATVRPIIGRCPAAHRNLWYATLVNPLCASLHERLSTGWMDTRVVNAQKAADRGDDDDVTGAQVDDLITERILRDITRDHCALLAIVASPEGTFGRKTKGSGLTGVMGDMSNTQLSTAYAGGKHVLDWINAGDASGIRAGIATGTCALTWEDAEATGHAVNFVRALTAAAGSNDAPQALRETVGAEVFQATLTALTQSSNAAHQADILGVIRDVIIWLLPKTQSVGQILMSLPGMTRETIDGFVRELGQMRSEKKAANYIKDFLIKASGGGEELRALVESRASSKSGSAIQIPKVTPRNPDKQSPDGIGGFSAEDATRAIGL
jgi:exportin-5